MIACFYEVKRSVRTIWTDTKQKISFPFSFLKKSTQYPSQVGIADKRQVNILDKKSYSILIQQLFKTHTKSLQKSEKHDSESTGMSCMFCPLTAGMCAMSSASNNAVSSSSVHVWIRHEPGKSRSIPLVILSFKKNQLWSKDSKVYRL